MIHAKCSICGEMSLLMNEDDICRMCETKELMANLSKDALITYIEVNRRGWPRVVLAAAEAELVTRDLIK